MLTGVRHAPPNTVPSRTYAAYCTGELVPSGQQQILAADGAGLRLVLLLRNLIKKTNTAFAQRLCTQLKTPTHHTHYI